mmetsp:Transcript_54430/g.102081  ORF Transcript_54430/g.102081 Transcript_54430/m.102081 type:complete len:396 (+) Transcript_54430:85-1272(+)
MACEVIAVQENGQGQDFAVMQPNMQVIQPCVTMLVPVIINGAAPVMMQGPIQAPLETSPGFGQWTFPPSSPQMGPMDPSMSFGYESYSDMASGYDGADAMDSEDKTQRRRRRTRTAQPKVPGMIQPRRNVEEVTLSKDECENLRKLLEAGGDQLAMAMTKISGKVWPLSRDANGCRVVQLAMEKAGNGAAKDLAAELHGHVRDAVVSPHANYVIQKVITQMSPATSAFIADELFGNGARFARHRFGCRIMCRLLEHCSCQEGTERLIDEVLEDRSEALDLCRHNFGHHVVQSVLEHGDCRYKVLIAEVLCSDLLGNASHRSASYVVESALSNCLEKDQQVLLQQLAQPSIVAELAQARYGFYVAKTLLQRPEVDAHALAAAIPAVDALMKSADFV